MKTDEKEKRATELLIANKEVAFQTKEKDKRAAELLIANNKLAFQTKEKNKRAAELLIANKELAFQNEEKDKRAAELLIANKELAFQNEEKDKRAAELLIANKELAFQNEEKDKRAAELIIANKELIFQNKEKVKRAMQTNKLKEHNLELELQKKLLAEASQHKSTFLSNMSHEIRTPINAIIGFTELALKTSMDLKQKNYLNKIKASSRILVGIIGDILDISKLEADKVELEIRPFMLEEMLQIATTQINTLSQEKGIELLISIAEDVPICLMGDSLRLGQILTNLTSNAVKFTNEGEIIIGVKLLKNGGTSALLQFSVKDTGIGLTKDQIGNLFLPFNQAETSTTRKYGGTGLGLAISRKLVILMGGEIWAESEIGKGSTFFVTIRFETAGKERFNSFKNAYEMWNMKVLVVDDSFDSQEIIKSMLTGMSFSVTTCSSGEEAIALTKDEAVVKGYDLILMDWKMSGIDGIETSKRIKRLFGPNDAPVIIMLTANCNLKLLTEVKLNGVDAVLYKPVTPSLVLNTIMQLFGKEGFEQHNTHPMEKSVTKFFSQLRGNRVLLVEDNEINQEVAQEILQQAGLTVTVANNGKEAIEMVISNTYDIILMDIQMPVMDGYDATREIRKNPAFAELPIIAMTANAMQGQREKCIQAGMNAYIPKPIDTVLLFQTMERWIKVSRSSEIKKIAGTENNSIPELDGIDTQAALSRLGGNQVFYRKLLTKFSEKHKYDMAEIHKFIDLGEFKAAERMVHTLKGAAGSIGAYVVFLAAGNLEAELRRLNKDILESFIDHLEQALIQIFDAIADLENDVEIDVHMTEYGKPLPSDLFSQLEKFKKMLEEHDINSAEYLEELIPYAPGEALVNGLIDMRKIVEQYDFDGALNHLDKLVNICRNEEGHTNE